MGTSQRKDPLPVFAFKVSIQLDGVVDAFFKSVSGLKYETEAVPVVEGGVNDTTFMLPGATKWSPIVLKQGFCKGSGLLKWREEWMSGSTRRRVSGQIVMLDPTLQNPQVTWTFTQGWPSKWEIAEFDASKSELSIETLEITHHGLKSS
ncbi:MAG TPA: phage tail protein [Kofleriaceae bacterium]|jgi:phage tail-like protein